MKDFLNAEERNQIMMLMGVQQNLNGLRTFPGSLKESMLEGWTRRNNLTKDEIKNLKMFMTYMKKFLDSVIERQAPKEQLDMQKRFIKFDFRLLDDHTIQKIYRDYNSNENAVVPKEEFFKWTEEIMHCRCNGCTEHFDKCDLYDVLEDNFISESTWNKENCKFAYEGVGRFKKNVNADSKV